MTNLSTIPEPDDQPRGVDPMTYVGPNAYEFSKVLFAGITRDPDNGTYRFTFLEPEFIEREIPDMNAKLREKPSLHMVHILDMLEAKIVDVIKKEKSYILSKMADNGGATDAVVVPDDRPERIRKAEDLPSGLITENVESALKIAQGLKLSERVRR